MFFDRQVLCLALLFAADDVLGAPLSSLRTFSPWWIDVRKRANQGFAASIASVSVGSPTGSSPSAVLEAVAQPTNRIYSLQNDSPFSSHAIPSGLVHAANYHKGAGRPLSPIPDSASASTIALPSQSHLTSPNFDNLRPNLARAAQSSHSFLQPGNVNFASSTAGSSQQVRSMASSSSQVASITAAASASASASSEDIFDTLEGIFNSIVGEVNSAVSSDTPFSAQPILSSSISITASSSTPQSTNALDVLLSALPESIAGPIQSELSSIAGVVVPAESSSATTTDSSSATATDSSSSSTGSSDTSPTNPKHTKTPNKTPTHRPTSEPTSRPTGRPTRTRPNNHHTGPPTTLSTSHTTSSTSQSTDTETTTQTDSTTGAAATNTDAPASIGAHPISNASIAGIATGLGAAAVLGVLAGVYIYRRKHGDKNRFSMFGRSNSKSSGRAYPEVAWLYDPKPSPPGSPGHSRNASAAEGDGAEERLMPDPRAGSMEVVGSASPQLAPVRPTSPLLAPHLPPSREQSPGGSPSGSSGRRSRGSRDVSADNIRLLRPINEE